ncbi:MAG: hypothetical protein ACXU61_11940 [Croceibacterium sp.]
MRLVWLTGIASLLLFSGLAWYLAPLEPGVLALQFAFTPRAFAQVVHAWPPEHLLRYRSHLPFDCLLLTCYGSFGYLLASRSRLFAGCTRSTRTAAALALPLAAVFDATENALHWWLTEVPRFGVVLPYVASAVCSTLKWALLVGFAIAVVHALVRDER